MQQDSQQANEILIQQSIQQYHEKKITNKTIHQAAKQATHNKACLSLGSLCISLGSMLDVGSLAIAACSNNN
jgi:hypothetical protein